MIDDKNNQDDLNMDRSENSRNTITPTMSPIAAAVFGLIAVFFLYQVGSAIIILLIFGSDISSIDNNSIRLLTTGSQILFILLPALVFAKLVYEDVTEIIRFRLPGIKEIGVFLFGMIIIIPLLQNYLYIQNYFIERAAESSSFVHSVKSFFDQIDKWIEEAFGDLLLASNTAEAILIVIVIAVVPAVCEEVFFRGFIQRSFEFRLKPFWAVFLTAFFFGLYHFNPYGLIALVFLGGYLGFAAYKTKSIFVPMILHFVNNFVAVMIYFIFENDEFIDSSAVGIDTLDTYLISFAVLLSIFMIFIYFVIKFYPVITRDKGGKYDMSKM